MEKKNTNSIDLLPGDITLNNIFTRLPSETVLHCKLVCKTWRNLLRSCKRFPYMHLRRQQLDDSKVSYILTCNHSYSRKGNYQLYYGEYSTCNNSKANLTNNKPSILGLSTFVKIFHRTSAFYPFVLGSCNGLIMCQPWLHNPETLYLSNPMTREYLNIPITKGLGVCGFGYDTSAGVYKIVRVDRCYRERVYKVYVYTVGSGIGWRMKENITSQLIQYPCIPSNGALHWLDYENRIWAFDLAEEDFRCIPSPQLHRAAGDYFELRLLGECLSMVHYRKNSTSVMDIWLLRRNNSKKRKRNDSDTANDKLEYYQLLSWNWSKEFSLKEVLSGEYHNVYHNVVPYALTKDGELLLFCRTTTKIYRYTVKSSISDKEKLDNVEGRGDLYLYDAIPYKKSFVSMKDLGERCEDI